MEPDNITDICYRKCMINDFRRKIDKCHLWFPQNDGEKAFDVINLSD